MKKNLKITQFDTIKFDYDRTDNLDDYDKFFPRSWFEEDSSISVDSYIKKLTKEVNNAYITEDGNLEYGAKVFKVNDNEYHIKFAPVVKYSDSFFDFIKSYEDYYLITKGYPHISDTFDKLCDITSRNVYKLESYRKVENNNVTTLNEKIACLNYLKEMKKVTDIYNLKIAIPTFSGISMAISIIMTLFFPKFILLFLALLFILIFSCELLSALSSTMSRGIVANFRLRSSINKKIKQIKKKIGKNRNITNDNKIVINNKDEIYRDNIINYMNNIMNAANKLNSNDKRRIMLELDSISDEYTSRIKIFNGEKEKGLVLNGGKRKIMSDILNKLAPLEMEVADILNQDTKNSLLLAENKKFKEELRTNIVNSEEDRQVMTSNGKVLRRERR